MRITGGQLCGRRVKAPPSGTRPTQDRVREALFSILQVEVPDSRFLDLFAGSGMVGLEAWSRGASTVKWVESDRRACSLLRNAVQQLCEGQAGSDRIVQRDVALFLKGHRQKEDAYDIIFADPPYDKRDISDDESWICRLLVLLEESRILSKGGVFVMEDAAKRRDFDCAPWRLVDAREYGKTKLSFFRLLGSY